MTSIVSIFVGIIGAVVAIFVNELLNKYEIDDVVGAIPVHLAAGVWGTLAVGIFGTLASFDQFMVQLASVGIVGVFCVIGATLFTLLVKSLIGLRVSEKEESTGLDISEHGTKAYFSS